MTLASGTRLGPYEITGAIGAGGMGEVFRARDTKLNRDVAIKVLPAAFADDPERLARFTREAQTLASLNHPNIATIHGIEEVPAVSGSSGSGSRALVMELVEGEDLSVHIGRGPIPMAEALSIARQIVEALEAAHEQGIVHRDLKPGNIKVREDGTVKVLDFGLAKATDGSSAANSALSHSPTMSRHMTEAGMILGTAAYMSPEQARGKAVDRRTDVWAFGCVLYEMLSGRRAFDGEDATEIISAVMKSEPEWSALPKDVPAHLSTIITRCLVKDRKTRIPDLSVVRFMLDGALTMGVPSVSEPAAGPSARLRAMSALTAVLGVTLIAALLIWAPWRHTPGPVPHKLLASIGADATLAPGRGASAILSPDGATLAFLAQQAGKTRLFVRRLDQLEAAPLAGTEDAANPFFSPDGRWIAFFAAGKLKKISVAGGAALNLCDAADGRGGSWAEDDTIIFTPGPRVAKLLRVSAQGGAPSTFGTFGQGTQRWPQVLPGGEGVLFTGHSTFAGFDSDNLMIAPLSGGAPKVVIRGGYYGRYVSSGHVVYMRDGTLFAIPFDLSRLETTGQAVPAIEGVAASPASGGGQVAVSTDGTLVYAPGTPVSNEQPIDWMTRDGRTTVLRAAKATWGNPRFSPDGQKLALEIFDGNQSDIWIYEWTRDILTQVTFDKGSDERPVWTPDGGRIVFSSDRAQPLVKNLYWVNADGTGETTRLTESPEDQRAQSWHPGGRLLAFAGNRVATRSDLMILPMEGDATRGLTPGKPTVFLSTPTDESAPEFSPDGRFLAYVSNESAGQSDVYVRPFPGPAGKWRISTSGGFHPRWSAASHELLFETQNQILAVPYSVVGDSFRPEKPRPWSPTRHRSFGVPYPYDVHPDGKRLAIRAAGEEGSGPASQDKVVFFFGFGEYLKKIAPRKP